MLVITMFSGNAMGDENYEDHSGDKDSPVLPNADVPVVPDPNPPTEDINPDIEPTEDRTRNKDA